MTKLIESDLTVDGGSTLHVYDTGTGDLPILWHHGTPSTGSPPAPLFAAAERWGVRWVGWDRPGYGGSSPQPDRPVASAATYAAQVADTLGLHRFAVMGHLGGGPHALACAALLPGRVIAAVTVASLTPYGAAGLSTTSPACAPPGWRRWRRQRRGAR
ncbi:hypothetical protein BH24ACT11_BH24ACT11_11730 [soil metagenome]